MHRMRPAEDLVGGAGRERRIAHDPLALLGMLEQREQAEADRVPGRLVPGRGQEDEEGLELARR